MNVSHLSHYRSAGYGHVMGARAESNQCVLLPSNWCVTSLSFFLATSVCVVFLVTTSVCNYIPRGSCCYSATIVGLQLLTYTQ